MSAFARALLALILSAFVHSVHSSGKQSRKAERLRIAPRQGRPLEGDETSGRFRIGSAFRL